MRRMLTLLLCSLGLAIAQSNLTPEQRQAILDYQLTMPKADALTTAQQQLTKYLLSLPNARERAMRGAFISAAEIRAVLEKDSKASAIITQNSLTVREYMAGTTALNMAYTMAATGASNAYVFASPANLAFAKAHLAELKPKMDAVRAAARAK